MNIQVGDYRIVRSDPLNLALEQKKLVGKARNPYGRKGRAGSEARVVVEEPSNKERWVHIGWYTYLETALGAMMKQMLEDRSEGDDQVQQILNKIDSAKDEIKKVVTTLIAKENEQNN